MTLAWRMLLIEYHWAFRRTLTPSDPEYRVWNARRADCFEGKAPYIDIAFRFDRGGAYEIHLTRDDEAIC